MKSDVHTLVAWCCTLVSLNVSVPNLLAATRVKANNTDNLNLTSSWTNNAVPGPLDLAQFDGVITGPLTVSLGADTVWNQLSFANAAGDVTINAGNQLTLSNNTPIIFPSGTANLTLNCDVVCAGTAFANLPGPPAGRTLTYGGVIQGRNVTVVLGPNVPGTLQLGSALTTQIGSTVQANSSGAKIGIGASSIGNPIVSGPLGTNLFVWNAATGTELFAYNGPQTLGNALRLSASPLVFNSADTLTFSSFVDLAGNSRSINVSNGVLNLTGTISNGTSIIKTGPGVLGLGGTNIATFGSGLSIFGGTVRLLASEVIPDSASAGTVRMTNTAQVLDLNGFSETVRGLAGSGGSGDWAGTLDNTAAGTTSTLTLGDAFTYTLAGNVQNSGLGAKLALVKIGTGGLILTNAKSFSGGVTNASAGEIFINSAGAAGTGPLVLAQPNAEFVYSGGGSLAWTNNIILQATGVISAADGNVLTLAGVISGPGALLRTNTLFQQGLLNFSGDNTFTGGFVLFGGSAMFSHPRAAGPGLLSIGHPTLTGGSISILAGTNLSGANAVTNAVLVNRDFTLGGTNAVEFAGPVVWITNATQRSINVTNPAGIVISGPVSGFGFNKTGSGLLTFNGVCSHNGPSTVSTGPMALGPSGEFTGTTTILVGGSASFNVSAVANFAVKPTQALRVDGGCKVSGNVTVNGSLTNNALFNSATFSNNLTLAAGSTSTFTVNRFFQNTTNLICLGTLSYGGHLVVNHFSDPLQAGDTFRLFGFTGNPGSFANLTLPALNAGLVWNTSNLSVDGTLSVVSSSAAPQLSNPVLLDPSNFALTATGGTSNGQFRVLSQTNLLIPLTNWQVFSTNFFNGSGALTVTNPINFAEPQRFFIIVQP